MKQAASLDVVLPILHGIKIKTGPTDYYGI